MIALITPTGGRPAQLGICSRLMRSQTYQKEVVWIIVDDCIPVTSDVINKDFRDNWTIIKEYPEPPWRNGFNTQGRNLSVGINTLLKNYCIEDIEAIFIVEDDDYYRPEYLEKMMSKFEGFNVIGEVNTIYYNVYWRKYVANGNMKHSSLFQVAFRPEVVSIFRMCYEDKFIDSRFFQLLAGEGVNLFHDINLAVGIKGLPGRGGIGAGHRKGGLNFRDDHQYKYLTNLIGVDAQIYQKYYGGCGC